MEAPEQCCPLSGIKGKVSRSCKAAVLGPMNVKTGEGHYIPGPDCPFVKLAAKDAEIETIDIVFDGPPSHEAPRFIEVENVKGESFRLGEWVQRHDGFWAIRFRAALKEVDNA